MSPLFLVMLLVGLASGAMQPTGPVYRSAGSVVSSSPVMKSMTSPAIPVQQPEAEERESSDTSKAGTAAGVSTNSVTPSTSAAASTGAVPNPQQYTVLFYGQNPQAAQGQSGYGYQQPASSGYPTATSAYSPSAYQQGASSAYQPASTGYTQQAALSPYQQQPAGLDWYTYYHVNDILVGVFALFLFGAGATYWYPKFVNVKARALRELRDVNSEDAQRVAKSVLQAIEKFYELNSTKD